MEDDISQDSLPDFMEDERLIRPENAQLENPASDLKLHLLTD